MSEFQAIIDEILDQQMPYCSSPASDFPLWLDPTPTTRALIATFAALPVREPFFHQRKQLKTGVPFKRAAQISNEARKQALLDELKATGETLEQRNKRKQREWRRAQRERYWAEKSRTVK